MKLRHALLVCLFVGSPLIASADTIYVDNVDGDDRLDGRTAIVVGRSSGPVRSLERAMRLARFGDTVRLANKGVPYYGTLSLTGGRHSGNSTVPFRIVGNGATLSGARAIRAQSWKKHEHKVWSFEPARKGHYQLMLGEQVLPRTGGSVNQTPGEELPEGLYAVHHGRVYYRARKNEDPPNMPFSIAQDTTGVSLYGVEYVIVQDLILQHFRLDGLNAHDLCKHVIVRKVVSRANARAGMTVTGSSSVTIVECTVQANQEASVRIDKFANAAVSDSNLDAEPTVNK